MSFLLGILLAFGLIKAIEDFAVGGHRQRQNEKKERGEYPTFTEYDETPNQDERWTKNAR